MDGAKLFQQNMLQIEQKTLHITGNLTVTNIALKREHKRRSFISTRAIRIE